MAPARRQGAEVTINSTLDALSEFLERMRTDDPFRAEFEANPGKVLARYDIKITGMNLDSAKLPPKGEVPELSQQHRQALSPFAWYRFFRTFHCGV